MPTKTAKSVKQSDAGSSQGSRPSKSKINSKLSRHQDDDDGTETVDGGRDEYNSEPKMLVKPPDQLNLSEAELKEEITRILTANNPHAPQNIVRYNFKERQYKPLPTIDQLAVHFSMDGNMIHVESDEAKRQLQQKNKPDGAEMPVSMGTEQMTEEKIADGLEGDYEEEGGKETAEVEGKELEVGMEEGVVATPGSAGKEKKLTNQFNYSDRASLTYNNPLRNRETMTEPPPVMTFEAYANQWIINDALNEDYDRQNPDKEKNKEKRITFAKKEDKKKKSAVTDMQSDDLSILMAPAAKILERMVNQNTYDDVTMDFKYFEDPSDEFREQEGTLLPLWKFSFDKVKKLAVTSITWSPKYLDLFAVGHGSYDFLKQTNGMILFYTLKNPSYPEIMYETDSGVMSLDLHPEYPYLLAVGFYNGNVAVYNVLENKTSPVYVSSAKTGKHTDPVWQVKWQKEDLDNNLNFFSISSDGRVVSWTLLKNEIVYHDVIRLTLDGVSAEGPDGTRLISLAGGTAFDFHHEKDTLFLVGTEEGKVHVCSKSYSSTFLETYEAHHMAVYRVAWNRYHPRLFITCSADWSVKIWDRTTSSKEPVFTFDLGCAVGDVSWSPYSSTIFAAVTADGKVHVFDLSINKYEPLCEQVVTQKKKTKLTHIAFNPRHPIVIVGDDRGNVTSLKLSPNLRKMPKEKKGAEQLKPEDKSMQRRENEYAKMEKLLSLVRQPDPKQKQENKNAETKEKKDDKN